MGGQADVVSVDRGERLSTISAPPSPFRSPWTRHHKGFNVVGPVALKNLMTKQSG